MSLSLGVASPEQPVASVTKTLAKLCSIASNRSCADCRVTLIDSSQVHASFNPKIELPSSQYNNFRLNHVNFAPPNYSPSKIPETLDPPVDPSLVAASYVGGHGVFVCALCGAAHKLLGRSITVVYAVQDSSTWSVEEVQLLVKGGGNNRARSVLEAHIPHSWKQKRPNADSTIADRLTFVRAKYEALAFVLPPSGPFANRAWRAILDRHQDEWEGNWGADLHSFSELQLGESHSQRASRNLMQSVENGNRESILPNRLVDYFCVVTSSEFVIPDMLGLDLSELSSPEDVLLVPEVTDCFPNQEAHADTEFPKHIGSLVLPDGCRPSLTPRPPSFFSFVLTCGDGVRLYGGALCLHDNDSDVENLKEKFRISGYEGQLPGWMGSERSRLVHDQDTRSSSFKSESDVDVDVVYFPKVLVVVSHYPFFDVWRKFLLQIYRIALVGAPLPIERFIANFVGEVPLPPPGKILVKFGLTVNDTWSIGRPPENQLPLADFSFQPLFAALSVSNVMVVIGCLLEEGRVALLSRHYAMLAPTAEALVSLLFPFHWQGMYLPVLPYNMIDILGAPVPFLVGLHSRYLVDVPAGSRPRGVVFVDLDRDVIHLGYEYDEVTPRSSPALPERQALKLKSKLETHASVAYVECDSVFSAAATKAATILTGNEEELHNSYRDPYARASKSESRPTSVRRKDIFGRLDRAYADNELQVPISGFLSEHGQFYEQDASSTPDSKGQRFKFLRAVRPKGGLKSKISADSSGSEMFDVTSSPGTKLLDKDDPSGFDSSEIRNAFLRLFVSIFQSYRHYLDKNGFRSEAFIDSLNCSKRSSEFLHCVVKTQFFSRFLDERIQNPSDPEIRFFDESIIAKINRSKKQTFSKIGRGGGKRETSFLKDDSNMVNETFTPPPPSNWGLPDDGRTYHYGSFPALNPELFGKVRRPMKWPRYDQRSSVRTSRRISALAQANEKAFVARALKPVSKTPKMLMAETKRAVKNLDTALSALSSPFVPSSPMRETNRERRATGSSDFSMSDISLSSALVMRDDIVSTAEGVVLNARRKQAILLGIIIKLQTHCRLHLVLKKGHQRESFRVSAEGDRSNLETNAIICLQKWYRVLSVGRSTREWFRKLRFATCRMQSLTRDRMVRAGFLLLVTAICRAQARIRGFQTRKIVASIVEHRLRTYREHIFLLWKASHTPLSYRCKFWPILKVESYLRVQMAEAEVHRLWSKLNLPLPTSMKNLSTEQPKIVKSASLLRMNFETHWACIILNIEKPILILDFSQKGNSKLTAGPEAQRINSERVQIYDRISALKLEQQLALFDRFSVPLKGKRKKLALAVSIWHATKLADESTALMLTLFTELNDSTNINFKAPTKKSLRRFPPSPAITPLKRALWAHVALEDRIRLNTLEVARIGLHDIPRLSHKFVGDNAVQTSGKNRLELMRRVLNCGASGVNTGETKSLQARHLFKPPAMFNRSHASKSDSIREVE